MFSKTGITPLRRTILAPIFAMTVACGDDSADDDSLDRANESDGGERAPATNEEDDDRLYVGATRVFTADGSTGLMFAVPSLEVGVEVDPRQAVEMSDAWVFGDGDPYFYTATIFEPTITRWTISEDGEFDEGPTISFANEGVGGTYTAAFTPVFAHDKSYFVDAGSAQVVIWDPEEMIFVDVIPLPIETDLPGTFTPTMDIAVRDDLILVTIFWGSADSGWTEFGPYTRVVAIDPETDAIVETNDEDRCETLAPGGQTSDGTIYYSPWDYHAAVRAVYGDGHGSSPCAMRIVPPGHTFDEAYEVDLSELVGGLPAGGLTLLDDDQALIHVWHDDLVEATEETWLDVRFEPGYKWYRWQLGDETATELSDQEPSTEGGSWSQLDGRTVTYSTNEEFSETTLYELSDTGELAEMLTVPGWTVQLIRVR